MPLVCRSKEPEKTIAQECGREYFFFDRARGSLRRGLSPIAKARSNPAHRSMDPEAGERPDYGKFQNCQPFVLPGSAAIIAAGVDRIEYADGTTWASATAPPDATPSP